MKILMLNATHMNIPFICAAKKLGFEVITTGNRPDFAGHKYASKYINADYSDIDAMERLIVENGIDAVCCGTSDNCAVTSSKLGERLGWKGHDSVEISEVMHRKGAFKAFTRANGIKSPVANYYGNIDEAKSSICEYTEFPVIVKPVNAAGGQGVSRVNAVLELEDAIDFAFSRAESVAYSGDDSAGIVIEPFVTGRLFSLMAFILDGHVHTWCAWEDYSYLYPYMVTCGNSLFEEDLPVAQIVADEVEKIATAANLVDGQITVQYIVQDGEPWIIEAMRRSPGNYTTTFASHASGLNWDEWIVRAEAGMDCSGMPKARRSDRVFGYVSFLSPKAGVFKDVVLEEEIVSNVVDFMIWKTPGHVISSPDSDKMGLAHLAFGSENEARDKMNRIYELIRVEVC